MSNPWNKELFKAEYPKNLFDDLFGKNTIYPDDLNNNIKKALDKFFKNKPEYLYNIIQMYYKEGMTFAEIGTTIGVTRGRARELKEKALRILRKPTYYHIIIYGEELKVNKQNSINMDSCNKYNFDNKINFSTRVFHALTRKGITTIEELTSMTEKDISKIRVIGKKSIVEIKEELSKIGLSLSE